MFSGGGYEMEVHYSRWKRVHSGVPRWTQLKESLSKLIDGNIYAGCFIPKGASLRRYNSR
jgi:hypothetical protein